MSLDWFAFDRLAQLNLSPPPTGIILLASYALLLVVVLIRRRSSFELDRRGWLLLAGCLLAAPLLSQALVVWIDAVGPLGSVPLQPLSLVPLLAAALWLGAGPAALVGLMTGLAHALFSSGRLSAPLEFALLGAALALMLRQRYAGRAGNALRHPLVAAPLVALAVGWPLTLLALLTMSEISALAGLERTVALTLPTLLSYAVSGVGAGLLLQMALEYRPAWRPVPVSELIPAPWQRQLSQRMLFTSVPLTTAAILVLVTVVAGTAYRVATGLVVEQMARDTNTASGQMPFFIQVGRSLIRNLAQDPRLLAGDEDQRPAVLAEGLRAVPYFEQLLLLSAQAEPLAVYPQSPERITLSEEELSRVRLALEGGIPAEVVVFGETPEDVSMSFIAAVSGPSGEVGGALVGRTTMAANPVLAPVVEALNEGFVGPGEGLILDDQNQILLYPAHPERQQQEFVLSSLIELPASGGGQAFRQQQADGTRELLYLLPVSGRSDWSIILMVPNEVALALALQIALPTLVLMVIMAGATIPLLVVLIQGITVPITELARAAGHIADGELNEPLEIDREDEIGRLGQAFEQMRVRLRQRLTEQQELLNISRSVSASLEGYRAMQLIANSALDLTQASGVRIVLTQGDDQPLRTYIAGEMGAAMAVLDRPLLKLVERDGTTVMSQLWRASESIDVSRLPSDIHAIVALPLRSERSLHGMLWLAYDHEHLNEPSEMTFLSTLAQQAAVAAENVRLFTEAEEGRRKLQAVVESTADGMVVVDNEGCVVLINPAAESYFGVRAEQIVGRRVSSVIDIPRLSELMGSLQEPVSVLELPRQDGQTFLANTSTIVSQDGSIIGRVAVLRDITALKELDNIKTVFLRMVSHDLRSPLTYMRGYLALLPLDGPLTERQEESVARIRTGIDHIEMMTERLTYLSRLQFGDEVELERTMIDVEALLYEVASQHERLAQQKGIKLEVEVGEKLPLLYADDVLFSQAVSNLVHNALKYSPEGSRATVRGCMAGEERLSIVVTDDGIGIRPEDQGRLFEAFYRVPQHEGDPERPAGSGLGLALVKAIAEAHNGEVSVQSEFRRGSTFTLTVPLRDPFEDA